MADGTGTAPEPSERPIVPGAAALDDPGPDPGAVVGSWSWWPQTGRMLWSEAVYEILGLDPAITEPSLERALELVVPEQRREIRRAAASAFEQQTTIDTDVRIRRPDGQERTLHLVARAQFGEAGIPDHWWGTVTDSTDRPDGTGRTPIARRVTEPRAEESELDEPGRKLVRVAERLDRHLADQPDDEDRQLLDEVVEAVERMADGIEDLLTYRETIERPRSPETVPLEPVAQEALDAVAGRIGDVQADVSVDELGAVEVDRQDVAELFERLLDNAFRFRREEIPLEIELSSHVEDGMRVVSVADNGQGIPAGHRDEVSELFHTAAESSGSGVGLAICRRIVDAYDGEILVASTEGEGTVFSFSLPDAGASATATLGVEEG